MPFELQVTAPKGATKVLTGVSKKPSVNSNSKMESTNSISKTVVGIFKLAFYCCVTKTWKFRVCKQGVYQPGELDNSLKSWKTQGNHEKLRKMMKTQGKL